MYEQGKLINIFISLKLGFAQHIKSKNNLRRVLYNFEFLVSRYFYIAIVTLFRKILIFLLFILVVTVPVLERLILAK